MTALGSWAAIFGSLVMLAAYEVRQRYVERRDPASRARSAHAQLRAQWTAALSRQPGSELLAVQTLRNSLMSATISASTAAIALMGALSLLRSAWPTGFPAPNQPFTPRVLLAMLLLMTLFACYVCSALAMRYFNHAGFVMSLPVGCEQRRRIEGMADIYVQRAGLMYSWGLRCFLLIAPSLAGLIHPLLMPPGALATLLVLYAFDRPPVRNERGPA